MASVPEHVGVYGGGRMGAGIAHAFLASGATVTVVEADQAAADAARERVRGTLAKADQIGKLRADLAEVQARLAVAADASAFAGSDLVVEAVPEIPDLKTKLLASVAQVAPDAVIATNTSSLSVDDLASSVDDPTRFIGLHFFNPVPASELVEIVVGAQTSADLVTQAQGWVDGLGKTGIVVKDSPASSKGGSADVRWRCLLPTELDIDHIELLVAARILVDGVTEAAEPAGVRVGQPGSGNGVSVRSAQLPTAADKLRTVRPRRPTRPAVGRTGAASRDRARGAHPHPAG